MEAFLDKVPSQVRSEVAVVMGWDLSRVKRRMSFKLKIPTPRIDALEQEYKRYLALCLIFRDSFPISAPVDEMWHAHLIDSPDYAKMEQAVGRKLIHRMTTSVEEEAALLPLYQERTLPRYESLFGKPDEDLWPRDHCVCRCDLVDNSD